MYKNVPLQRTLEYAGVFLYIEGDVFVEDVFVGDVFT